MLKPDTKLTQHDIKNGHQSHSAWSIDIDVKPHMELKFKVNNN